MCNTLMQWMCQFPPLLPKNRRPIRKIFAGAVCLPVLLAGALFSAPATAADVWTVIPVGASGTPLTGTLNNQAITLTSAAIPMGVAAAGPTPGFGLSPDYDIWDNDATPANTAKIWPATAKGNVQVDYTATPTLNHLTVKFATPLVNPKMLVYSLDRTTIDYSSTRSTGGTPAILSVVKNPGATYDPTTQKLGTLGIGRGILEGCPAASVRGCAVVTFMGTYSQLDMDIRTDTGTDGVGLQFGVDPAEESTMRPVPTLSQWGLVTMGLLLAGAAGATARRPRHMR